MNHSLPSLVLTRLQARYDLSASATEFLHYENPYQILIATILSAQTTDKTVNLVTRELFFRYPDPLTLAAAPVCDVEKIIRKTGFYHVKARNIIAAAQVLISRYNGIVPDTIQDLQTLPGVGRKTANIVLHHAFGITEGIAVDTHVSRLSNRLGLSGSSDPLKIEQDLLTQYDQKDWGEINGLFILHGRKVCTARRPACHDCILKDICRYPEKTDHSHI